VGRPQRKIFKEGQRGNAKKERGGERTPGAKYREPGKMGTPKFQRKEKVLKVNPKERRGGETGHPDAL